MKSQFFISETEPTPLLKDFSVFIKNMETLNFSLTKTNEFIPRKICFDLNKQMTYPASGRTSGSDQTLYPLLHLFYNIVIAGKLFQKIPGKNKRYSLKPSDRLKKYRTLTNTEKYFFLLETFWIDVDWKKLQREYFKKTPLERVPKVLEYISKSQPMKEIDLKKKENSSLAYLLYDWHHFLLYFSYFGFWEATQDLTEQKLKHDFEAETIKPTALGVIMSSILNKNRNLEYWNLPVRYNYGQWKVLPGSQLPDEILLSWFGKTDIKLGWKPGEAFYKTFTEFFPEGELKETLPDERLKRTDGAFIFEVFLSRSYWRKIKISGKHTLLDLHNIIQEAYGFDDDHMYCFFMDGQTWQHKRIKCRFDETGPYVDEVCIGELGLFPGQIILYLFDYGDEWRFKVKLEKIISADAPDKPLIISRKGENPQQY